VRRAVTKFESEEGGGFKSPFVEGDSLYVEIHSVTFEAFDFLNRPLYKLIDPGVSVIICCLTVKCSFEYHCC